MTFWYELLWPFSRVRNNFAPIPLPFAPSLTDIREWNVEIEPPSVSLHKPLPKGNKIYVSIHRILIETGIAMTLATSSWDPRSWFALYRYYGDFLGTEPSLRYYPGVQEKDPRLSAVASEEVATGITCYILREHFGIAHISDVYPCIQNGELEYVDLTSGLRPDYFCEDLNGETILAESKGSKGPRCTITGQIDPKGLKQVQNVRPTNLPLRQSCGRIVIGTNICVEGVNNKSETTTIIKDPNGEDSHEKNINSDALIRLAYGKLLRFSGNDIFAERVILGKGLLEIFPNIQDIQMPSIRNIKVFPIGILPFGGLISLYAPIAIDLISQKINTLRNPIRESLHKFRGLKSEISDIGYALNNGVIITYDTNVLSE